MKRLLMAAAMAVSFATASQAEPAEKIGDWELIKQVSEMTGRTDAAIEVKSRPGPPDALGQTGRATLTVACLNGQTASYVQWPSVLRPRYNSRNRFETIDLAYRINDGEIQHEQTALMRYQQFGFWRGENALRFKYASKYVVQVNGVEAVFDLAESKEAHERLLSTCR